MEKKVITLFIVIIVTVGIISGTFYLLNQGEQPESIDAKILSLMEEGDIPSLAAGIIINDNMIWSQGYGEQSDIDTVYMIGSVTKMFTATAIMQLVESGKLDLDADINTYIPFSVRNPNSPSTPITIRMLLSHQSGISKDVSSEILWDYDMEMLTWANNNLEANITLWETRPTLEEFLDGSLNSSGQYYVPENWASPPGLTWDYSSTSYLLLSYIVEQVTDQTFTEYLNENIFTPLEMTNTGYDYIEFLDRNAIPYELRNNNNFAYPLYNQYNLGAGGLRSTVSDLGNFLIAHMNQGQYKNKIILQPDIVDLMQTSQFHMSGYDFGGAFNFIGYGLGWPLYENQTIGHGGGTPGYIADITFQTVDNSKYGIVFLTNRGSSLVEDDYLMYNFVPSVIKLLFEEASRLASN